MNYRMSIFLIVVMTLGCSFTPLLASESTVEYRESPIQLIAVDDGDILLNQGWDYYATALQTRQN